MSDMDNIPVEQLWYTWSDVGLSTVHAGLRVRAASPELTEIYSDRVRSKDRYMRYALPPETDRSTITPDMAPIGLAFIRSEWSEENNNKNEKKYEYILVHKNYLGKDGFGRSGNFFVHVLALGENRDFPTEDAIWQWGASIWKMNDEELDRRSTKLKPLSLQDLDNTTTHFRPEQFRQVQSALQFIIEAYLTRKDRTIPLYIAAPANEAAKIASVIAALTNCLPAQLLTGLTFSTYEPDITKATTEIVGTSWIPISGNAQEAATVLPPNVYLEKLAVNCATGEKSKLQGHPQTVYNKLAADFAAYAAESLAMGTVDQLYVLRNYAEKSRDLDIPLFLQMYNTEIVNTTSMGEAEIEKYLASELRVEWLLRRNSRKKIIDRAIANPQWSAKGLYNILLSLRGQAERESLAIAQTARRVGTSLLSGEPEQVPGVPSPEIQRRRGKNKGSAQAAKIQATQADALALLARTMIPEAVKRMEQAVSIPATSSEYKRLADTITVLLRLMDACILPGDPTEVWKQLFEVIIESRQATDFLQSDWAIHSWLLKTWSNSFHPNSQDDDRMRPLLRIPWSHLGAFLRLGLQTRHIQWVIFPIDELVLDPTTLTPLIVQELDQNYAQDIGQILNTLAQGRYFITEAGLITRLVEKGYRINSTVEQHIEALLNALNRENHLRRTAKDLVLALLLAGYVGSDHYQRSVAALTQGLLTSTQGLTSTNTQAGYELVNTLIDRDYPRRGWLIDVLCATQATDLLSAIQYVYPTPEGQNTFFLQDGSRYLASEDTVQPMLTLYKELLPLNGKLNRLFLSLDSIRNPERIVDLLTMTPLDAREMETFLRGYGQRYLQQTPRLASVIVANFVQLINAGFPNDLLFTILPPQIGDRYLEQLLRAANLTPTQQIRFLEEYGANYLSSYPHLPTLMSYISTYIANFQLEPLERSGAKTFFAVLTQQYQHLALDTTTRTRIQCWQIVDAYFHRPTTDPQMLKSLANALPFLGLTNDAQIKARLIQAFFLCIQRDQDLSEIMRSMRGVPNIAKEKAEEYNLLYTLAELAAEQAKRPLPSQIGENALLPYLLFALTMPTLEGTPHFFHLFLDKLLYNVKVLDVDGIWKQLTTFLEEKKLQNAAIDMERWYEYLNGLEIGDKLNLPSTSGKKNNTKPKSNKSNTKKSDPGQTSGTHSTTEDKEQAQSWIRSFISFIMDGKKPPKNGSSDRTEVSQESTAVNMPNTSAPNNNGYPSTPQQSSPANAQQPDSQGTMWKKPNQSLDRRR